MAQRTHRNCRTQRRVSRGFTMVELMTVVAILGVLTALAGVAFTKYVRRARAAQIVGDLSSIAMREKAWYSNTGHYVTATGMASASALNTLPLLSDLDSQGAPLRWDVSTNPFKDRYAGITFESTGNENNFWFGKHEMHGFDALEFTPEKAEAWCGYGTVSGLGLSHDASSRPSASESIAADLFPTGTDRFFQRDWYYAFAICDSDGDKTTRSAYSISHYSSRVSDESTSDGVYVKYE